MKYNFAFALMLTLVTATSSKAQADKSASTIFPDSSWSSFVHPGQAGWDTLKLDSLKKYLIDSTYITGFMIVEKGKIVFEYGDIQEVSYIASCRKSVLAMLYGEHVKSKV